MAYIASGLDVQSSTTRKPQAPCKEGNAFLVRDGDNDLDAAIDRYEEAKKIREERNTLDTPEAARLLSSLASALLKRKQVDKAIDNFNQARRALELTGTLNTSDGAKVLQQLGQALLDSGEPEKAKEVLEQGIDLHPKGTQAGQNLLAMMKNAKASARKAKGDVTRKAQSRTFPAEEAQTQSDAVEEATGLSPSPTSARQPELDVFVDVFSIDCYLALDPLIALLGRCCLHWRSSKAKARMSVPIGSGDRMSALSKKQAYQLRIQRSYAELRGLPLDLPAGDISAPGFATALAYVTRGEAPLVAEAFLRRCFALVFDGSHHVPELDEPSMRRIIVESGGSEGRFLQWQKTEAESALREERELEAEHSVWTTPFIVDRESKEVYIDETTFPLLALHLRRRGYDVPEVQEALGPSPLVRVSGNPTRRKCLDVYVDLKSPYAYLAVEPTYSLEDDFYVDLVWKPFVLDIAGVYGSAEVGARNNKVRQGSDKRSPAQWKAVKYSYANVRRYAGERTPKLTVFGTRKIWDTRWASSALLFAAEAGYLKEFQQHLWPPFWRRELDPEDLEVPGAESFPDFAKGIGRERLEAIQREAVSHGVFGVPTYILDGQLFFGREHLPLLRRLLYEG
ncbi:unnamed protein product, partial [Symbiodinium microadriaticum]